MDYDLTMFAGISGTQPSQQGLLLLQLLFAILERRSNIRKLIYIAGIV